MSDLIALLASEIRVFITIVAYLMSIIPINVYIAKSNSAIIATEGVMRCTIGTPLLILPIGTHDHDRDVAPRDAVIAVFTLGETLVMAVLAVGVVIRSRKSVLTANRGAAIRANMANGINAHEGIFAKHGQSPESENPVIPPGLR
jgi:hypothetical protein